jgi:sec-independent protein translocase protein TatA
MGPEWIIVAVVVVVVLFGGSKIPKLARGLGEAKKEFEQGMKDGDKPSDGDATK